MADYLIALTQSAQQVLSKEYITSVVAGWGEKNASVLKAWLECPYLPEEAPEALLRLVQTAENPAFTVQFLQVTVLAGNSSCR